VGPDIPVELEISLPVDPRAVDGLWAASLVKKSRPWSPTPAGSGQSDSDLEAGWPGAYPTKSYKYV
jgi:hypothetical protein